MTGLTLKKVSKQYKKTGYTALRDINLEVANDEFLVILGPSGCGKTTLLRIIAGLETATEGEVLINGKLANDMEPQERGIGMVFQNYALYPHMTVKGNLSFSLNIPWYKRAERDTAIQHVAEFLDIRRYFTAKPYMLSGGERQRVAMGRAMVNDCQLYLLDEPLSNLDDSMRSKLRPEILRLFKRLEVPFLYVTHDQTDAMTMGTRIAVMRDGIIQQIGTPYQIYYEPANMFIAGFVGTPKMNFIQGEVITENGKIKLRIGDMVVEPPETMNRIERYTGKQLVIGIRPEDILTASGNEDSGMLLKLEVELKRYEYLGNNVYLYTGFQRQELCITASSQVRARVRQKMDIYLDCSKMHMFDPKTEVRL